MFRLLLVDDNAEVRTALRELLAIDGFDVEEADGALTALAHIERAPLDVVICDWDLGGESSEWLLLHLAATQPRVGRVLLSGSAGHYWQSLVDAGVVHVALQKPSEHHEMVAAIRKAIATASSS